MFYLWLKAFHLVAVVCWFAALFYLPRLFVYHSMAEDEISIERFKIMERKLYKGIANPAMMVSIALGLGMIFAAPVMAQGGWFHAKMALVALVLVYHFMCKHYMKRFADNTNTRSHLYFRWFNEVPVVLLILIAILAVVKPF